MGFGLVGLQVAWVWRVGGLVVRWFVGLDLLVLLVAFASCGVVYVVAVLIVWFAYSCGCCLRWVVFCVRWVYCVG